MKIAVIDDEEDARYLLRKALQDEYKDVIELIVEVSNVTDGISILKRENFDIIFLDIQLQDGTGFDLLEKVGEIDSKVVFVTAFDDFALRAFEFYAFAYLVKPFKLSMLIDVVNRIREGLHQQPKENISMVSAAYKTQQLDKIVIPELEGFQVVQTQDILFIKSDNNYSEFVLEDGSKVFSSRTLKDYERLLTPSGFFRIHRSYLINVSKVRGYSSVDGSFVKMGAGLLIPIGRRKLAQFRNLFLG